LHELIQFLFVFLLIRFVIPLEALTVLSRSQPQMITR